MSKITPSDVASVLKERIEKLNNKIKKTQTAITALLNGNDQDKKQLNKKERKIIKAAKKKFKKRKSHSKKNNEPVAASSPSPTAKNNTAVKPSSDSLPASKISKPEGAAGKPVKAQNGAYNSNVLLQDKITYALKQTGPASKEDILKKIMELEPGADSKKLNKAITTKLAVLDKSGKIKTELQGGKNIYTI